MGITNGIDHVTHRGTPGWVVLCELTKKFHPVLSPLCTAKDSRSRERLSVIAYCYALTTEVDKIGQGRYVYLAI